MCMCHLEEEVQMGETDCISDGTTAASPKVKLIKKICINLRFIGSERSLCVRFNRFDFAHARQHTVNEVLKQGAQKGAHSECGPYDT